MNLNECLYYNLNIINLNKLIEEKIWIEIENFLFDNNLQDLPPSSKDRKKIYNHFIASNIINILSTEYNNIFIYNDISDTVYADLEKYITNIVKIFKISLFKTNTNINDTKFSIDNNLIYEFKLLLQNKKKINFKQIRNFCDKNSLIYLSDKIKNNIKTKMLLYK
jgi:hypothetical protein